MVLGSSAGVGSGMDLKNEEDVKEYVEKLSMEYRFGCYHEKNPNACHLLGDYWEGIKTDFAKAFRTYEKNCVDYNFGHSCHKAAGYTYFGKGCTKDADRAYDLFMKGCDLGYHKSCYSAGLLDCASPNSEDYVPRSIPADRKKGLELFRKSCDDGNFAEGCYRYAAEFIRGMEGICDRNMETAFKYSLKACNLGDYRGCANVAVMYQKGDGVERNHTEFLKYQGLTKDMVEKIKSEVQPAS